MAIVGAAVVSAVAVYVAGPPLGENLPSGVTREQKEADKSEQPEKHPRHNNITTTVFWAGEPADGSNDHISNVPSAWQADWTASFGGVDDPDERCGYKPCGFEPLENPFYFALPFGDYTKTGPKPSSQLKVVPWFEGTLTDGESLLKNHWIEVTYSGAEQKVAYAQWEDVGPVYDDDWQYVFGSNRPKESRSGLDVSPAVSDFLGLDGKGETSWRFVDEKDVPDGPWKDVITRSAPRY